MARWEFHVVIDSAFTLPTTTARVRNALADAGLRVVAVNDDAVRDIPAEVAE